MHLNKKVFEEVVEERITPQLNELSKSVATGGENVIGTMEAIGVMEDTVKGSEIHLAGKINVIEKKLDKLLGFEEKLPEDEVYEANGLQFIMNPSHGLYLFGMEVDWHGGLNSRGFTFANPNASKTCGCGTSFSV